MIKITINKQFSLIFLMLVSLFFLLGCETQSDINTGSENPSIPIQTKLSDELQMLQKENSNIFWIKGTGSIKQKQEIIEVNLAIEHRDKEIINATKVVNENIKKILEIADDLGITNDQIITDEYSISPVTRWVEKEDEYGNYGESQIIAYRVYNSVIITSENKDIMTSFIDKSNAETGNSFRINNIRFKAKLNDENKVLAREKAVDDAIKKAEFYEEKLEIELGKIISFEEFQSGTVNKSKNDMTPRMMMAEAMPSTELFGGESEIISEIYLGFEIK